jgi:hypothetical protein
MQEAIFLYECRSDNVVQFLAFDDGMWDGKETDVKAGIIMEWIEKSLCDVITMIWEVIPFKHRSAHSLLVA